MLFNNRRSFLIQSAATLLAPGAATGLIDAVTQQTPTAQPPKPVSASTLVHLNLPIAPGPFTADPESFQNYQTPDWFRDAKFGIWSHWGPQAVPRKGDWYAKMMYDPTKSDYKDHLERYGHPSEHGYKDIIPLWKAERWNPDELMALYKKTGAKYFVSMGIHHDNFALWNSPLHRWNSVNMGPNKDVVGLWQKAARTQGLRFGVSEHLGASYNWFQTSHQSDKEGPLAGVPYDGNDPRYWDLYHTPSADTEWLTKNAAWHQEWFSRIKELVDAYHPDLLYSDSGLPFGEVGSSLVAHYYNQSVARNRGRNEAVYNCKQVSNGHWVQDLERGVKDEIDPYPWQTDTSIGDWYYRTGQKYKTATEVIQLLVDNVSKNGNLLINVVQTPEGDLEPDVLQILDGIGAWMALNGEGIYGSRPWKVFGEKPSDSAKVAVGNFNENKVKYSARDIRFTTKNGFLYAFCLGTPFEDLRIVSLGRESKLAERPITSIHLLGSREKLVWTQEDGALVIKKPNQLPASPVIAFKIAWK